MAGGPALRDWARYDGTVAACVARVDGARVAWRARVFYAGLPGLQAMLGEAEATAQDLHRLLDVILGEGDG